MENVNVYQGIYDLIVKYLFGGAVASGSAQELITVGLSAIVTVWFFSLIFTPIVYLFKRMFSWF